MPDKHEQAEQMRDDVPSTIARSDDKAVRAYRKAWESAEDTYDSRGERARRTAFSALKHTHEKVADHWEPKEGTGPSDPQAEKGAAEVRRGDTSETASGVDTNASKEHLVDVAERLGIKDPQNLQKPDLVAAIEKANAGATRKARER
ncbi:ChaB protein [Pseudonocardia ammonioxydans]|uniref:ChaB protein n=1 Tax=Pseudonocardia ammonioxydans TaxID=260086 RepID=A0A1I5HKK2_PSUAM|nr:ChaB family protein [Pseudonocardia ammonioxydans]SFO48805.1 ChaB protein [Pseudonocardia ammonioxydans]